MSSDGYEDQVIPLGLVTVNPIRIQSYGPGSLEGDYMYCIDLQNGTGVLIISTRYSKSYQPRRAAMCGPSAMKRVLIIVILSTL